MTSKTKSEMSLLFFGFDFGEAFESDKKALLFNRKATTDLHISRVALLY